MSWPLRVTSNTPPLERISSTLACSYFSLILASNWSARGLYPQESQYSIVMFSSDIELTPFQA